jgi:dCTP diphosphatase
MQEIIEKIKKFRQEHDWDQYHSPKNLVMALSVEVAELVEHFQWLTQEESRNIPDDKLDQVRDEIGDILIYLANLSEKLGIDPVQAAHDKIEKNQIKYPADTATGKHSK